MVKIELENGINLEVEKDITFSQLTKIKELLSGEDKKSVIIDKIPKRNYKRRKKTNIKKSHYRKGISDKVHSVLLKEGKPMSINEIASTLGMKGKSSKDSIRNALKRLYKQKKAGYNSEINKWGAIIREVTIEKPVIVTKDVSKYREGKKWTEEEKQKLKELLEQVRGRSIRDWQFIGEMLGRSAASCAYQASVLGYTKRK